VVEITPSELPCSIILDKGVGAAAARSSDVGCPLSARRGQFIVADEMSATE
jgi:hypothetical protein